MTYRISTEAIQRTREHFADISRRCIEDAQAGRTHVNDLSSYVIYHEQAIADTRAGAYDHTFAFRQMAHYFDTGHCVALFAN